MLQLDVTKMFREVEVQLLPFLPLSLDDVEYVSRPCLSTPLPEYKTRRRCLGGWVDPRANLEVFGKNINKLVIMA